MIYLDTWGMLHLKSNYVYRINKMITAHYARDVLLL